MIFGQLASTVILFAQFYAGTRRSIWDFWRPLLEQPIKFVLKSIFSLSFVNKLGLILILILSPREEMPDQGLINPYKFLVPCFFP